MKLVVVKFRDSTTFDHWAHKDEVDKSKCKVAIAIGLLWEETEEITKVVLLCSENKEHLSNWVVIPTPCVITCDVIKEIDWEVPNED